MSPDFLLFIKPTKKSSWAWIFFCMLGPLVTLYSHSSTPARSSHSFHFRHCNIIKRPINHLVWQYPQMNVCDLLLILKFIKKMYIKILLLLIVVVSRIWNAYILYTGKINLKGNESSLLESDMKISKMYLLL